jgi:ribosomal protein S27E
MYWNSERQHQFMTVYCASCGHEHNVPVSCGNRFCPICSRSRAFKIQQRLDRMFKIYPLQEKYAFRFLTLTIPKSPDISSAARHLVRSFRKFRNRNFWKRSVTGGAYFLEVSGLPDAWHVHLHIVYYGCFIPGELIGRAWFECSGGKIFKVKTVYKKGLARYLTKYLTKNTTGTDYSKFISNELSAFRLFQVFGNWSKLFPKRASVPFKCPQCGETIWIIDIEIQNGGKYG